MTARAVAAEAGDEAECAPDVRSSAAVGILDENGAWLTYSWGRRYGYGGMGAWTDWVPLTTPTFRVDYYSYSAGWPTPKPQGVSFDGYEYRRYETGAMPYFPPFRFPGQYADVESGLFENWNRFYDPRGSYVTQDPLLETPAYPASELSGGKMTRSYMYAYASPVQYSDPTGLYGLLGGECRHLPTAAEAKSAASLLPDTASCLKKCILEMLDSDTFFVQCEDRDVFSDVPGNARLSAFCALNPQTLARTATGAGCTVARAGLTHWCDRDVSKSCQIQALVHEAAHACGWREGQGQGIPGETGTLQGCGEM